MRESPRSLELGASLRTSAKLQYRVLMDTRAIFKTVRQGSMQGPHSKVNPMVLWYGPLIWNPHIPIVYHAQKRGSIEQARPEFSAGQYMKYCCRVHEGSLQRFEIPGSLQGPPVGAGWLGEPNKRCSESVAYLATVIPQRSALRVSDVDESLCHTPTAWQNGR